MSACNDSTAGAARNNFLEGTRLHRRSFSCARKIRSAGFSLIEVLLVVLVAGILFGTGISIYAGVTQNTQTRARTDELQSFFRACQHRAMLRKTPVTIMFHNQTFFIQQSSSLKLRIPELDQDAVFKTIYVNAAGVFFHEGQPLTKLALPIRTAGNRTETVTLEL